MKSGFFTALLLVLLVASTSHAGLYGSLVEGIKEGERLVSVGYLFDKSDWEFEENGSGKFATFERSQAYVQLSYGVSSKFEVYVRGGASDFEVSDGSTAFDNSSFKPFGGVGFNKIVFQGKRYNAALFGQANIYSAQKDSASGTTVKFETPWDASFGGAMVVQADGGYVYGGPLLFVSRSKLDIQVAGNPALSGSTTVEEQGIVGGVFGIAWEPTKDLGVTLEGQYRSSLSGGLSFAWKF